MQTGEREGNFMTTIIIFIVTIIIGYIFWKRKPVKNSHKLPQSVEVMEFSPPENGPKYDGVQKGHRLTLSREKGFSGYHLFVIIDTNGKNLANLKKIIISWSEWQERFFNFSYNVADENISIQGDQIRIDVGSFNNCDGSHNFLKRTVASNVLKIDLLDFEPEEENFEYEENYDTQSVFCPCFSKQELNQFNKGLHYINS